MSSSPPETVRLLSEIAHKLDYAINSARKLGAPSAEGQLDPAILQTIAALFAPQSTEQLYERVMDLAVLVTGAERGFLMLVEEGRKLRYKVGRSIDRKTLEEESETSRTVIRQVVSTGQAVFLADTSKSQQGSLTSSSIRGLRMRSILCVPILFGDLVGGVIYLDTRLLVQTFKDQSLELLQYVAVLATEALGAHGDRARLEGLDPDAGKLQQNFERLLDVGQAMSSTLVLDELLELVIEKVLEITRADRGFLMLIEPGGADPVFKIGLNWNKKDGPARRLRRLTESQFQFSRTTVKRAITEKSSVVFKDAGDADPSVSMMQMELNSVMVTPLIEKGEVLGLIYVDSKMSNKEFGESDVQLFEALAGQAAVGLKNALLYSQVAVQQRIESEIAIASQLQADLCPKVLPRIQGIEYCGFMQPAREVGGDYYDFVEDPERLGQHLSIVVGDVSGKGLGAGMVAVMARCFLRSMLGAYGPDDPSMLLTYLNATLTGELKPGSFMTMLLLTWDAQRSAARYASAGHENLIVWRQSTRQAEVIPSGGSPLGLSVTTGSRTPNTEIPLQPGDTLVLYTDGVTEAMDPKDEEYTLERLVDLVNAHGGGSPQRIQDALLADLNAHRGPREPSDDITFVILRRT
ncbi:MAG: SpoIIE family protein phosphatase [Planctomycetota bacterium]